MTMFMKSSEEDMHQDTAHLLRDLGIPFRHIGQQGSERVVIPLDQINCDELRTKGFRLGHGNGAIRYLLYYQGHFCGVVM